jgi:plasmid stabilization system protein ParE
MGEVPAKPLEWTRAALDQLEEQIENVAAKGLADPIRVGERIERALDLIRVHPRIGTPGRRVLGVALVEFAQALQLRKRGRVIRP